VVGGPQKKGKTLGGGQKNIERRPLYGPRERPHWDVSGGVILEIVKESLAQTARNLARGGQVDRERGGGGKKKTEHRVFWKKSHWGGKKSSRNHVK